MAKKKSSPARKKRATTTARRSAGERAERIAGDARTDPKLEGLRYEVRHLASWNEFVQLADSPELDGWAFRGQEDSEWPLFSSLSRYLRNFVPGDGRWGEQEGRGIRIFRRKAHHFVADPRALRDDLRTLALMQHHGAPTRLLDVTKSPYVAAFFALEKASGEAAVWAVNTPVLANIKHRIKGLATRMRNRDQIDTRTEGNFWKYFQRNLHEIVWAGEPFEMDRRLTAQSGTFLLPGVLHMPVEEILARYPNSRELLVKIVLPAPGIRSTAMRALYRMNLTNATLFPDLDGLARSIGIELELNWRGMRTLS
jgi:hypothetical protein